MATATFGIFKVSANKGVREFHWGDWRYRFKIAVRIRDSKPMYVTYHDSAYNYGRGVETLSEDGLRNALVCILEDSLSYAYNPSIAGFASEFGYEYNEARQVFNACRSTYERLLDRGATEETIASALDSLNE